MKYKVIKYIAKKKYPWLPHGIKKGTILYSYPSCTYGCISPKGEAITFIEDQTPFYEVPKDSIKKIRSNHD